MKNEENRALLIFKSLLSGKFLESDLLKKNRMLLFFIFLLMFSSIMIRFKTDKVLRESDKLDIEIKDLRAQSITIAADLIKLTRPSQMYDKIQKNNLGLKPSKEPPRRIKVKKIREEKN